MSKWAINCFVQTVRRQVFKHGIRVVSISPGPVITALLADWPPEKLKEAKIVGEVCWRRSEVANVVMFMLTRPRGMTIRDVVMMPTNFDSSRDACRRHLGSPQARLVKENPEPGLWLEDQPIPEIGLDDVLGQGSQDRHLRRRHPHLQLGRVGAEDDPDADDHRA